ncbi:AIPR family protein [Geobacter sulfurreducens]|uniref:AIPR family protein n=1 Tax=Geobacter sulfurreducens TaxID=35554 RepID=UPI0020B6C122|nr:AIPR family protein [Geobacter sulfurreducens]UTG91939.1 AIPR family protein [Geobacter sulfurreducens]
MSVIHVNQIKSKILKMFAEIIDTSDLSCSGHHLENFILSRALAAYSVQFLANCDVVAAVESITDGCDDNGIDAIYYDERDKRLILVQAKWIHSGKGEPDNGDVKKFIGGIVDLLNYRFDNFNAKIRAKQTCIEKALEDPYSRFTLVITYTGNSNLAQHSSRDLDRLKSELNDTSDLLEIIVLNQQRLHSSLTIGLFGEPIVVDLNLKSWGKICSPFTGYYGHVAATQIAEWWQNYHSRLFNKNLRGILGDTEVNLEIRSTLKYKPEHFWYLNNGITIVAKKVVKTHAYAGDTEFGVFRCEDISIVNGAQTVGTIGKFSENITTNLESVYLPIRIISLEGTPTNFGEQVTRATNRQNRIDSRDFVTLDVEQNRLRQELAIDGITYFVSRSDRNISSENSFDLVESTTALACASGKPHLVVILKKEIGKLWEDIDRSPYKELFNNSISGLYVWRCVSLQRKIDVSLGYAFKKYTFDELDHAIISHGNRLISSLVFHRIGRRNIESHDFDFEATTCPEIIDDYVNSTLVEIKSIITEKYSGSGTVLLNTFKNIAKTKDIYDYCCGLVQPNYSPLGQLLLW